MCEKFSLRGYPERVIDKHRTQIKMVERSKLRVPSEKKDKVQRVPFISTYNPNSKQISEIVRRHWTMLTKACPQVEEFKVPPLMS